MPAETTTTTFTREQLYERIWSTPMTKLMTELGTTRATLIQLCGRHQIPRPGPKYWGAVQQGRQPDKTPLMPVVSQTPATITIRRQPIYPPAPAVLVRQAIAELGDAVPVVQVEPLAEDSETANQNKQLRPEGGIAPYSTGKMVARAEAIEDALRQAMAERGHQSGAESRPGVWRPWFRIGSEDIRYHLYEPDTGHRHYFTQAELKAAPYLAGGKGWEQRVVPSGILRLGIAAGYGGAKLSWRDEEGKPLETRLGEIVIALEVVAVIAAEETVKRNEAERQRRARQAERERRERRADLQDERWERLCKVTDGWHQARRVRAFLSAFTEAAAGDKRLAGRAAKWAAWAEAYVRSIDPLPSDPEEVLRRLAKPRRKSWREIYDDDDEY